MICVVAPTGWEHRSGPADAGIGAGLGGTASDRGGPDLWPSNAARLGSPLQCRRAPGLVRSQASWRHPEAHGRAGGGSGGPCRARSRGGWRWRRKDLAARIERRFGIVLAERSVGALLKRLAFRHVSVRPQHPQQDIQAFEAHKENFAALVAGAVPEAARDRPVEVWWQDEARVGQQGTMTYVCRSRCGGRMRPASVSKVP